MRTAVVGHTEWIEFGNVEAVPAAGDIVHATDAWEEPGGGGAVAAVQLARLAGSCTFYTAFGGDEHGEWSRRRLEGLGVRVEAAIRDEPTRRAVVFVDANGERTITTLGRRLEPTAADRLPWNELEGVDAVYVTAGDPGALREGAERSGARRNESDRGPARQSRPVSRRRGRKRRRSCGGLRPRCLRGTPHLVVRTRSVQGGRYETSDGRAGSYEAVTTPGPVIDTYGAGDSFAAGLTFALGAGMEIEEALAIAARCGAWCAAGRGPYGNQLTATDL